MLTRGNARVSGGRYIAVDIARVIATCLIVYYHSMCAYSRSGGMPVMGQPPQQIVGGIFLWGRVPFFLVLSGFLASMSLSKPGMSSLRFIWTRSVGLGVPYLFWNGIALTLRVAGERFGASFGDIMHYSFTEVTSKILGFGENPADGPMWFVRDIIIASCIAPFLLKIRSWLFVPSIALIALSAGATEWTSHGIPHPSSFGFYSLGILLYQLDVNRLSVMFPSPLIGFVMCLCLGCVAVFLDVVALGVMGPILGACSILLLGIAIAQGNPRIAALIHSASPSTFLIFAANVPMISMIRQVEIRYWTLGNLQKLFFYSLVPFILTIGLVRVHVFIRKRLPQLLFPLTGGR